MISIRLQSKLALLDIFYAQVVQSQNEISLCNLIKIVMLFKVECGCSYIKLNLTTFSITFYGSGEGHDLPPASEAPDNPR